MDHKAIATLEVLPRLESMMPAGAIAISGDMTYPDFRARGFPDLLSVLWGTLVWTAGDLSIKDAAAVVSAAGIKVSRSSFAERLERATDWLESLLSMMLCGNAVVPPDDHVAVLVGDSTSLSGPGSTGTDFRVHALFDSFSGALVGARITDASVGESVSHHPLGSACLPQYDRGYGSAKNIHSLSARETRFLVRCHPRLIRMCTLAGELFRADEQESLVREGAPFEKTVLIPARVKGASGPAWHKHRDVRFVEARLIGLRTPKGVLWLLTNMPAGALPAKAAGELYRSRWQIELLFKTLKGVAGLDRLKSRSGPTAKAWVCGKLILAALAQRIAPSFEPQEVLETDAPYRASALSRFRAAFLTVVCLVLARALMALVSSEAHLQRLRNSLRRRLQQPPVMPIGINVHQPLIA